MVLISVATFFLFILLIALSFLRSSPNPTEQTVGQIVLPTAFPFFQPPLTKRHTIDSNEDVQLSPADRSAIDEVGKKLPIDTSDLKVEYSELLDTFYIQSIATDGAQLNQFLEENKLANLYKSNPKFFKVARISPKEIVEGDEDVYIKENNLGEPIPTPTPTPNPNDPTSDIKPVMNTFKSLMGFSTVLTPLSTTTTSRPVRQPTQQPGQPPTTGSAPGIVANRTDCNKILGNERIVCAALKYTGIRYGFVNNQNESIKRWGVRSTGTYGRPPAEWIATRTPEGPTDFLVCSSYTDLAIYVAFGFYKYHLSHSYLTDKENFREIDIFTARPGDLLIKGTAATGDGHVGIFVKRYADGSMQTLESTSAKSGRSGYFTRIKPKSAPGAFNRAVRYIGPGSTP